MRERVVVGAHGGSKVPQHAERDTERAPSLDVVRVREHVASEPRRPPRVLLDQQLAELTHAEQGCVGARRRVCDELFEHRDQLAGGVAVFESPADVVEESLGVRSSITLHSASVQRLRLAQRTRGSGPRPRNFGCNSLPCNGRAIEHLQDAVQQFLARADESVAVAHVDVVGGVGRQSPSLEHRVKIRWRRAVAPANIDEDFREPFGARSRSLRGGVSAVRCAGRAGVAIGLGPLGGSAAFDGVAEGLVLVLCTVAGAALWAGATWAGAAAAPTITVTITITVAITVASATAIFGARAVEPRSLGRGLGLAVGSGLGGPGLGFGRWPGLGGGPGLCGGPGLGFGRWPGLGGGLRLRDGLGRTRASSGGRFVGGVGPGAKVIPEQARHDLLGALVGQQAASEVDVLGMRDLAAEGADKEVDHVGFGARLEIASARQGPLDGAQLVREPEQVEVPDVGGRHQGDRGADLAGASRATSSVHVLLGGLGKVEVDDVGQVRDVDAAGGHVGRHQEAQVALARGGHDLFTVGLAQVRVEPAGGEALLLQRAGHALGFVLRVAEHDGALGIVDLDDLQELGDLVAEAQVHEVLDFEGADVIAAQRQELGALEPVLRHALNVGRQGGAEEQRLTRLGQVGEDLVDLRQEPHAQHLVRFVEHERADGCRRERAPSQVVEHPARRADHDLSAALDLFDLTRHRRAAVDRDDSDPAVLRQSLELTIDLECELTGRAQDQHLHRGRCTADQGVDDGHAERRRLAGSGSSLDDQVFAARGELEHGPLHRGGMGVAQIVHGVPKLAGERQHVEGGRGLGRLDGF